MLNLVLAASTRARCKRLCAGRKYNLPSIDIFNPDGTERTWAMYAMDCFWSARRLKRSGGCRTWKTGLHQQGFSSGLTKLLSQSFHAVVPEDENRLNQRPKRWRTIPSASSRKYKNTYRHWMENIMTGVSVATLVGTSPGLLFRRVVMWWR